MLNLTTATPAEIDDVVAVLYVAELKAEDALESAVISVRRALGQRAQTWGRGASKVTEWPGSKAEAVDQLRAMGDAYIGGGQYANKVIARYDAAVAALEANLAEQRPLNDEFARRGGWTQFFAVEGGHIHRSRHCSTCNRGQNRTKFGWLVDMSGMDETQALTMLAEQACTLCTVCFPNAPIVPTVAVPTHCLGSGKPPVTGTARRAGRSIYGDCTACPDRLVLTMDGWVRKHKAKDVPAAPAAPEVAETPEPAAPQTAVVVEDQDDADAATDAPHAVRVQLADIGQVTRGLTDAQLEALCSRLGPVTPTRVARPLAPSLASRLVLHADQCGCTATRSTGGCPAHPGFSSPDAALAALSGALEAQREADAADFDALLDRVVGPVDAEPDTAFSDGDENAVCRYDGAPIFRSRRTIGSDTARDNGGEGWRDGVFDETGRCVAGEQSDDAPGTPVFHEPVDDAGYVDGGIVEDEGDEARDCVRVSTLSDPATGQSYQWCATHRKHELVDLDHDAAAVEAADDAEDRRAGGTFAAKYLGPRDGWDGSTMPSPAATTGVDPDIAVADAELDDAADADAGVAGVLALADAAPLVTVADPAGLLSLVEDYGRHRADAIGARDALDLAEAAELAASAGRADAVLRQIAEALGLGTTGGGTAVIPAPRQQ
jgi:hypothetical protein